MHTKTLRGGRLNRRRPCPLGKVRRPARQLFLRIAINDWIKNPSWNAVGLFQRIHVLPRHADVFPPRHSLPGEPEQIRDRRCRSFRCHKPTICSRISAGYARDTRPVLRVNGAILFHNRQATPLHGTVSTVGSLIRGLC